ncbi:MAG TPA: T9SS type A sorting domain-containing protein, partial [Candidatus Krumholzibacterium sp.]|nr:T9SS type A sorting domain-containing protein [Candidatus Krumholzibacterium sp.]
RRSIMASCCRRIIAVSLFVQSIFMSLSSGEALAQTSDEVVLRNVTVFVDIYGFAADTVYARGLTTFQWSERYFDGMTDVMDTELLDVRVHGELGGMCVSFTTGSAPPSPGKVEFPGPGADFPAESFFDVFFEVTIPDFMPADTLHTIVPVHITDIIDQVPPYFCVHEMTPPSALILYDRFEAPVGEILYWREEIIPYSPPEAYITAETSKGTDIAVARDDTLTLSAAIAGYVDPLPGAPACIPTAPFVAEFSIRPSASPDPFMLFFSDYDGTGGEIGSVVPMNEGDGWAGYLDVGPYPPEGDLFDIEVRFDFGLFDLRDTISLYLDPTPPIPGFVNFEPDSICYCPVDSINSIVFQVPANNLAQVALQVRPLAAHWTREIVGIDQHDLSDDPDIGDVACGPAAGAACLNFWVNNGYPELAAPEGSPTKPASSPMEIAKELMGDMDPKSEKHGANPPAIEAGIKKYMKRHGASNWKVESKVVNDMSDLAGMMREFEADSEDVIMILSDVDKTKNPPVRKAHSVTMSSRRSEVYEVEEGGKKVQKTRQHVDFMNPHDGTTGTANEYEVATNNEGHPTTKNYSNVDNFDQDSRIHGFIKVSPPAGAIVGSPPPGGSGWRGSYHVPQEYAAPAYGEWTIVDSHPGLGGGLPDTLRWDTTGFPGGLYLMELTATDMSGRTGTALRFAGIPEYLVDADEPEIPPAGTGIRSSYPNPFNPTTTIEYTVARRTAVTMSVYDVSGRLVDVLIDAQVKEPGVYRTVWDGSAAGGDRVASGVYLCVIRTEDGINSRKMILLR